MNKPVVHYRGQAVEFMGAAILHPLDHPNHLDGHSVSNECMARTSRVISWDKSTGRIETINTIYEPESTQPQGANQ